jgi:sarcosine oxidase
LLETPGALIIASQTERTSSNHVANFFQNTVDAAKQYDIPHEILSAKEIRSRFPAFNVDDDEIGYHEFEGGFLRPEECVARQLSLAKDLGATIHTQESFKNFEETGDGVTVRTDKGTYKCEKLVLSVGPWLPQLVSELSNVFKVYRQVLYWFDVESSFNEFVPENFPVFIWELKGHENGIYGFPAVDGVSGGFKIASEKLLDNVTPESVDRSVSEADTMMMFENKVHPFFPKASSKCVKSVVCLYTSTQDSNFVIDWLPNSKKIIVCSPCSGHGFKHSAAIGECVAQLVTAGEASIDLSEFNLARLL